MIIKNLQSQSQPLYNMYFFFVTCEIFVLKAIKVLQFLLWSPVDRLPFSHLFSAKIVCTHCGA